MRREETTEELMIQSTLTEAARHPSQVISTVRHLLNLPFPALMNLHLLARDELLKSLKARAPGGWPIVPMEPVIGGRGSFTLKPTELNTLEIEDCHDFLLDFEQVNQRFGQEGRPKFLVTLRNCRDFFIQGGQFANARNICILENCEGFSISRMHATGTEGYGIIAFNSRRFEVCDCVYLDGLASGLYCLGNTSNGWIHDNTYHGGGGYFNWDAGLHINHCSLSLKFEDIADQSHEPKRIVEKTLKPSLLYVENNLFSGNRAQGIYCEGATLCHFTGNTLSGNNKEGICFDWGSAMNLFSGNTVIGNGERAGLSEAELKADFIGHYAMLPDGSSSCKLPGVSLDNGAVNFITGNKIQGNFGGGVKMVRTGIGNLIYGNAIIDNARGRNQYFSKFNGVLYLGMGTGVSEFRQDDAKLDFYPSEHNFCFRNVFRIDDVDSCIAHDGSSRNNMELNNARIG